jgi:uncharacterized repeat protein (TIGR03803 family)
MQYTNIGCALALLSGAAIAASTPACAGTYKSLYEFKGHGNGCGPTAGLTQVGGRLYGTARDCMGTFFSFNPGNNAEKTRYRFGSSEPQATMVNLGGTLYGITIEGGAYGWGAVYAAQPGTGAESTVYSFHGSADGYFPEAILLDVGGTLYGTTVGGGTNGQGSVFAVNPGAGTKQVVYSFKGGTTDGSDPQSGLINVNGMLYGTTADGGAGSAGTVYAVDPSTGTEKILYSFTGGSDGGSPYAGLINVAGTLYGANTLGGSGTCVISCGTVFAIDLATGTETVVHSFQGGTDGAQPFASLLNVGSILYGTTEYGGMGCLVNEGCGTVYSINLQTGTEHVIYAFKGGTDGANPLAPLIDVGGTLYGTTYAGGMVVRRDCHAGCGTIFSYTP